jgi:formate-dependent nitrite reductase membrane component NrfD
MFLSDSILNIRKVHRMSTKDNHKSSIVNRQSYYGRPVLKKPHWVWHIWLYFWLGGIAAGAGVLAAVARLFGSERHHKSVVRTGRYISLAGLLVSPVLLILDLQRPERFHHMLRIFKTRSALGTGTYILTGSGLLAGLNAARQIVEDGFIPANSLPGKLALLIPEKPVTLGQGVFSLGLGSYTGVLLSSTAIPLWHKAHPVLGPLFLSSAFSSGAAAISLAQTVTGVRPEDMHALDQIEQAALAAEITLLVSGALRLDPRVRRPLTSGKYAAILKAAIGSGIIVPLGLTMFKPARGTRFVKIISALLTLNGAFWLRFAIVEAGKVSADDPQAYHAANESNSTESA